MSDATPARRTPSQHPTRDRPQSQKENAKPPVKNKQLIFLISSTMNHLSSMDALRLLEQREVWWSNHLWLAGIEDDDSLSGIEQDYEFLFALSLLKRLNESDDDDDDEPLSSSTSDDSSSSISDDSSSSSSSDDSSSSNSDHSSSPNSSDDSSSSAAAADAEEESDSNVEEMFRPAYRNRDIDRPIPSDTDDSSSSSSDDDENGSSSTTSNTTDIQNSPAEEEVEEEAATRPAYNRNRYYIELPTPKRLRFDDCIQVNEEYRSSAWYLNYLKNEEQKYVLRKNRDHRKTKEFLAVFRVSFEIFEECRDMVRHQSFTDRDYRKYLHCEMEYLDLLVFGCLFLLGFESARPIVVQTCTNIEKGVHEMFFRDFHRQIKSAIKT
jgi:hypothetical protein